MTQQQAAPELSRPPAVDIRSVRPGDAELYKELFATLSDNTIHQRYFAALKNPPQMILEWFQKPQDGQVAFVATKAIGGKETMVGIARLVVEPDSNHAEFAVLIGDPWQGQGIGAELMRRCLKSANTLGVKHVRGVTMPDNIRMIALAKSLGFSARLAVKARLIVLEWEVPSGGSLEI